tara:strand:- start:53 stop:307 length:255 start_codon:yes stop_codon:yes gene_type:complete
MEFDLNKLNSLKVGDLATPECLTSTIDLVALYGSSLHLGAFEGELEFEEGSSQADMSHIWNGTDTTNSVNKALKTAGERANERK